MPPPPRVSDLIDDPLHAGPLDGATTIGEAERGGIVRVGLWLASDGRVRRARFRTTSCAALCAYAEAACAIAEADPARPCPSADRIRAAVAGVHPVHHDRADAVALAFARAFRRSPSRREEQRT